MKKITTIVILALTSLFSKAQDIEMMAGSMFSIYQLQEGQSFWLPDQEPVNTIVDLTSSFNANDALRLNRETKNMINLRHLAVAWMGFIEIEEAGVYVFSLQDTSNTAGIVPSRKTSVYINNNPYLVTEITKYSTTTSATKTLKLDPGFYKIDFVRAHTAPTPLNSYYRNSGSVPTLTYWNKLSPTKKTAITPVKMKLNRK